jgi:hypothetical protein
MAPADRCLLVGNAQSQPTEAAAPKPGQDARVAQPAGRCKEADRQTYNACNVPRASIAGAAPAGSTVVAAASTTAGRMYSCAALEAHATRALPSGHWPAPPQARLACPTGSHASCAASGAGAAAAGSTNCATASALATHAYGCAAPAAPDAATMRESSSQPIAATEQ